MIRLRDMSRLVERKRRAIESENLYNICKIQEIQESLMITRESLMIIPEIRHIL